MKTIITQSRLRHLSAVVLATSLFVATSCAQAPAVASAPPQATAIAASTSTPSAADLQRVVDTAYAKFKDDKTGKNADYIPYLASVPSHLFGVVIVTADGKVYSAGDIGYSFSIQSCSKVFTMCQVMQESGPDVVLKKIGVEPTGQAFNSVTALGMFGNKAVNPLVNCGAMASVSLIKAKRCINIGRQLSLQVLTEDGILAKIVKGTQHLAYIHILH